jgi:hypothetical protein
MGIRIIGQPASKIYLKISAGTKCLLTCMPDVWRTQRIWSWRSASPKNQDFQRFWFRQPVTSTDIRLRRQLRILSFSHKNVKRTERMVAKSNFNTKIFLLKTNFSSSNIFLQFEVLNLIYKNIKKYEEEKNRFLTSYKPLKILVQIRIQIVSRGNDPRIRIWIL